MSITIMIYKSQAMIHSKTRSVTLTQRELEILGELLSKPYGLTINHLASLVVLTQASGIPSIVTSLRRKLSPEYGITKSQFTGYRLEETKR